MNKSIIDDITNSPTSSLKRRNDSSMQESESKKMNLSTTEATINTFRKLKFFI